MSRSDPGLLYLYCVLEPESAADALLSTGEVAGVEPGGCLFAIRASNLVAAVSRVPSDLFSEQALNELMTDLPRLAPYAIRHEQAIRDLFDAGPALLPMTFGAVYLSEARVRMLLRNHAADFRHRLEGVRDRQEWEVKVFEHPTRLRAAASARSAGRSATVAAATASGPGAAYLLQRLQERWSVEEAGRMTAEMLRSIQSRLATISSATRIENFEGTSADNIDLVCKVAVLVPTVQVSDLRRLLAELGREYEPLGMSLELSGPWAPYSFVGEDRATH